MLLGGYNRIGVISSDIYQSKAKSTKDCAIWSYFCKLLRYS